MNSYLFSNYVINDDDFLQDDLINDEQQATTNRIEGKRIVKRPKRYKDYLGTSDSAIFVNVQFIFMKIQYMIKILSTVKNVI